MPGPFDRSDTIPWEIIHQEDERRRREREGRSGDGRRHIYDRVSIPGAGPEEDQKPGHPLDRVPDGGVVEVNNTVWQMRGAIEGLDLV